MALSSFLQNCGRNKGTIPMQSKTQYTMVSSAQGISWATRFSPKPGSFMFCVRQLSTLLIVSALIYVGLLFANLLSGVVSTWVTWAALTACMIVGASVILCVLTPKSVLKLQFQNCIRLDGSWSQGRQNAEATKQLKLFREIVFAITVVVVPTIFTLWIVNRDIVRQSLKGQAF